MKHAPPSNVFTNTNTIFAIDIIKKLMQPFQEYINYPVENSFIIKYDDFPHFSVPWHYHSEYELVYVIKSSGKRFVGSSVEPFNDGDLVFLGSNLPHFHLNDEKYYQENRNIGVKAIVIQFPSDYFHENQLQRQEFASIAKLLKASVRGLKFGRQVVQKTDSLMHQLLELEGLERYLRLLELLNILGNSRFEYLSVAEENHTNQYGNDNRMARVNEFISTNYTRKIKMEEAAEVARMNPSAFCRYFRAHTGKTFAMYVNELRIGYACKLLRYGNNTIAHICFDCGFSNLSNFNRRFLLVTGKTPSEYRRLFRKA